MKNVFNLILSFALFCTNLCSAQENNSMLWKISGNGLKQSSYVQGTMHMMCASDFHIKQKTWAALDSAQKLVLELDYTNPSEMQAMQKMMHVDQKLTDRLTPAETKELSEVLNSYGVTLQEVNNYSLQALYTLIGKKAIPCPQTEVKMFEIELLTKAAQTKKTFGGLETVADQIKALGTSYDVKETIRQLKAGDEYAILAQQMIKAFNDEQLQQLDVLLKDKRFMTKKQEDNMLNNRNIQWATHVMPAMMEKESVLFAVGGGHLWGEKGILQLLRSKGYTVTPVK